MFLYFYNFFHFFSFFILHQTYFICIKKGHWWNLNNPSVTSISLKFDLQSFSVHYNVYTASKVEIKNSFVDCQLYISNILSINVKILNYTAWIKLSTRKIKIKSYQEILTWMKVQWRRKRIPRTRPFSAPRRPIKFHGLSLHWRTSQLLQANQVN